MVEKKICNMKYIRTYETEEKFLADKDSTSRGFRLKPTLYKYSEAGDHVQLELDDPRKHEGSTYMEITLDSDVEFSFYIGNKSGDTQTTMNCSIDWGDGTIETKTITKSDRGFKLAHSYVTGSYKIELYDVERGYSIIGTTYGSSSISHSSSVKRVILGSGSSTGDYAFSWCNSLTSVYISKGVTGIGGYTFMYCSSLTSVYIPESVVSIGSSAFSGCTSLTSINLPEGVTYTYIGASIFDGCTSLISVYIPEGVNMGVNNINYQMFNGCSSLTSINIPESVTIIDDYAFNGCSSLNTIFSFNTTAPALGTTVGGSFNGISRNGILHIKPGATGYDAWLSKLPSGWTIVEDL